MNSEDLTPNYYAVIPANVRYDERLKDKAKLLYGEITSLSSKDGVCYASNNYFANLYKVKNQCISELISELVNFGYLERKIIYKNGTKEIDKRILSIPTNQKHTDPYTSKNAYPIRQKAKENNTSNNIKENIDNNNTNVLSLSIKERTKKTTFVPPTLDEIKEYCEKRNNGVDAQKFFDYYQANEWKDKNNKIVKNWKQKMIANWENKGGTKQNNREETIYTFL